MQTRFAIRPLVTFALCSALLHFGVGVICNYVVVFCLGHYDYKFGPEGTFNLENLAAGVLSGILFVLLLVIGGLVEWTSGAFSRASWPRLALWALVVSITPWMVLYGLHFLLQVRT